MELLELLVPLVLLEYLAPLEYLDYLVQLELQFTQLQDPLVHPVCRVLLALLVLSV